MADIRPWSIEYICARIALMLQQGTNLALRRLAQQYFIMRNTVMYFVLMLLWLTGEGKAEQHQQYMEQEIFQQKNIGYLAKMLRDGQRYTFILVDGLTAETTDIALLERTLQLLGHQTMRIGQGRRLKQEHYTMEESVRYTIETAISKGQGILFRPVIWGEDIAL